MSDLDKTGLFLAFWFVALVIWWARHRLELYHRKRERLDAHYPFD